MLLTNGRIYTLDPHLPVVDSLVLREGRVAFAGHRGDIDVPTSERVIDLGGRAVLPGLVDAHGHLMYLARARLTLNAAGAASGESIGQMVRVAAEKAGPDEWVGGRGWDQNLWPGRAFPTRGSLDRAAPRNPVVLVRVDGHASWCHSAALPAAGLTR